ncbi:MAG: hypothetical protein JWQ38_3663 [Flavipsychrobacter sp.]|nr:hypothetical protein [Flavipsychrobacter sp.]
MISRRKKDWYEHLVDQSATDHIYILIHGYLPHDWEPDHELDMVVLRTGDLPPKLSTIPDNHISLRLTKENYCFPGDDYVLLDDFQLTPYLEAARRMKIVEDFDEREYIELLFTNEPDEYLADDEEPQERRLIPDYRTVTPALLENKEDAIGIAYELLRTANERELAYEYAKVAEAFLNSKGVIIGDDVDKDLYEVIRIMLGYNVVAMVYAWNDEIDEAAIIDDRYLRYPNVWDALKNYISPYLEMLMAKKQGDYLTFLFHDADFKNKFLAHYEAYISLFVDDSYELTRMQEVVGIINRINNALKTYL